MLKIKRICGIEADDKLKVGTMRVDFKDGSLANKWMSEELFESVLNVLGKKAINEIQSIVNYITFEKFDTFDKVVGACTNEGYEFSCNRFYKSENFKYWVRLIPVRDEYNYYIKVYLDDKYELDYKTVLRKFKNSRIVKVNEHDAVNEMDVNTLNKINEDFETAFVAEDGTIAVLVNELTI